eukprot:Em0009g878a
MVSTCAPVDYLPPPEFAKAPTWTVEQQTQELERRWVPTLMNMKNPIFFSPRPTDVIIATTPKSGTTWVSHICHQLRTKGAEPDFENQTPDVTIFWDFVPPGINPDTMVQPGKWRIFLTHHEYDTIPKGGKLIFCFRDPKDTLYSNYPFQDYIRQPIVCAICLCGGNIVTILKDVLLLFYDDLKEAHTECVRRIAKFIGVYCDEETIARVVHTTTHAEMVKHESKFDFHNIIVALAKQLGDDPPFEVVGRVRKDGGQSGHDRQDQQKSDDERQSLGPERYNLFCRVLLLWVEPLLWMGWKRNLKLSVLDVNSEELDAQTLFSTFDG